MTTLSNGLAKGVGLWALAPDCLGSDPSSTTFWVGDNWQDIQPPYARLVGCYEFK